jgi:hypothetical protein
MNKATSTLIAAFAALTLSGGAYAQAAGGSNGGGTSGSTASPSNQMNGATSGYGTPGTPNSESGMAGSPNSGLPNRPTTRWRPRAQCRRLANNSYLTKSANLKVDFFIQRLLPSRAAAFCLFLRAH